MSLMKEYATEIKVGALVFAALVVAVIFFWFLGDYTPIGRTYNVYVLYEFAGGVELGTPVRVSGIKVGKVTDIEFLNPGKSENGTDASLKLKLNVSKAVRHRVRGDSKFFVNQAGIIGERYIEITPGTGSYPEIEAGSVVRGVDPPRFDQLISQSMDVFGEVSKIIEDNKEGIEVALTALTELGKVVNEMVGKMNEEDIHTLRTILKRVDRITADLEVVVSDMRRQLGPTLKDVRFVLGEARPVIDKADELLTNAGPLMTEAGTMLEKANGLLTETEKLVKDINPMVAKADRLLGDVDALAQKVRDLPDDKREEVEEILGRMTETAKQLQDVVARLDAFTAMVETQYSDMDRAKIEEVIRQFLQVEGVKINVGEVKFRDKGN